MVALGSGASDPISVIEKRGHRLVIVVAYRLGVVYIKFVGTYQEYDRIDAATAEKE